MVTFMDKFFSKFQCGFRKGYSTQPCIFALIKKYKSAIDSGKSFGVLFTNLTKSFECLPLELLLVNLNAYDFILSELRFVRGYLFNRQQITKINAIYSSWEKILFSVPQGSILRPLLFNIFICDMFTI